MNKMQTFLKANMASVLSSLLDFTVTVLLKEWLQINPVTASIGGTISGGIFNFFICRHWVFGVPQGRIFHQSRRYLVTWAGNLLLNAGGVYLLIDYAGLHYLVAKTAIAVTVAVAYNYPLQKRYVFKNA
jgi:putative flippase GtrA